MNMIEKYLKKIYITPGERQKNIDNLNIIEYQKVINLLDNTPNLPNKFRTKYWVETSNDASRTYNTNSQIKFKISILKSTLWDYSDAYILLKVTISIETQTGDKPNN